MALESGTRFGPYEVVEQVVSALEAAHGKQIVHRDLKPANVKLRNYGAVEVIDQTI